MTRTPVVPALEICENSLWSIVKENAFQLGLTASNQISGTAFMVLWHVDPLLGNERKISNYTTAIC
jgi:hypothetical protein